MDKKKIISNSKMVVWTFVILLQMTVIHAIDVNAEMESHKTVIEKTIHYPDVEAASQIPETIEIQTWIDDQLVTTIGQLQVQQSLNEHWQEGFMFPVTFHMYQSDFYQLGDWLIPYNEERPDLEGYEALLLQMIGLPETEYHISDVIWNGEPYTDESGELCRSATAFGEKLTWDIIATYIGEVEISSVNKYSQATELLQSEEIPSEAETVPSVKIIPNQDKDKGEDEIVVVNQEQPLWQKVINTLLISVAIGAILFFGGLLVLFVLRLVKIIRTCYNKNQRKM